MLDMSVQEVLAELVAMQLPPVTELEPADARSRSCTLNEEFFQSTDQPSIARVEDREIAGSAGRIDARVYWPDTTGQLPTVVYFHGGGWVLGSLESADYECRLLCRDAAAVIVSVGYHLAPEAQWPVQIHEGLDVLRWVKENIGDLGGDPQWIALAGESAGATIAASVAAASAGDRQLHSLLLFYPPTDLNELASYPSREDPSLQAFLTSDSMRWFIGHYAGTSSRTEPLLSPLSSHSQLPPTLLVTAGFDPLRDEQELYLRQLQQRGVDVTRLHFDDLPHPFVALSTRSPSARRATQQAATHFARLLRR